MTKMNRISLVLASATGLLLGGCETMGAPANSQPVGQVYSGGAYPSGAPYQGSNQYPASNAYSGYGVVQSITPVSQGSQGIAGTGFGLGTVIGAAVGGVAGHQVSEGNGKNVATAVGAAGGAYVGHQLEKRNRQPDAYAISIRMENGNYQNLTQASTGGLSVGDRVRINNGIVQRY